MSLPNAGAWGTVGDEMRELEARPFTELPHQAHAEGVVVAHRPALAAETQPRRDELALHVVVKGLDPREALEVHRGRRGVVDVKVRERAQGVACDRVKPVALAQRPLRVRLIGEETAVVQRYGASQVFAAAGAITGRKRGHPCFDALLEGVGVDPHALGVKGIATAPRDDEGRLAAPRAPGLEPRAQSVDDVPDVVAGTRGRRMRADGLGDGVGRRDLATLADEIAQELSRALLEPFPGDRTVGSFDEQPAQREDAQT